MENINLESENDELLLLRLQQGSRSAFNVLFYKYWEQTYSNAYKRLGDSEQSKDIVQEIFASIWINRQNPINNLPAYLSISVRNQVFKLAAKNKNLTPFFDFLDNIPAQNDNADSNIYGRNFIDHMNHYCQSFRQKDNKFSDCVFTKTCPQKLLPVRCRFPEKQFRIN